MYLIICIPTFIPGLQDNVCKKAQVPGFRKIKYTYGYNNVHFIKVYLDILKCTYILCSNANSNPIMHFNVLAISVNLWQNHKISLKQATTSSTVQMKGEKNVVRNYFSTQPSVLDVIAVLLGLLKIDSNSRNI